MTFEYKKCITLLLTLMLTSVSLFYQHTAEAGNKAPRNRGRVIVGTHVGASVIGIARSNSQQVDEGSPEQRKKSELEAAKRFKEKQSN